MPDKMSFTNKVVIVTGGCGGIGAATSLLFAKEGARVVIADKNEEKLPEIALKCSEVGKEPLTIAVDVSKDDEVKLIIKKTIEKFGKIDILVNNAGITGKERATVRDSNLISVYDEVMNTNLRSVVLLTSLSIPYLIETKGNIVNISSIAGIRGFPGRSPYSISKAGVRHFGTVAALELAELGVRVNSISPGLTNTNITANLEVTQLEELKAKNPQHRIIEPEEIARVVGFLASDKAMSITGSNYVIDCGSLAMYQ